MLQSVLTYCSKELSKKDNKELLRDKVVKPCIEIIMHELKDWILLFGIVFTLVISILLCILFLLIFSKNTR
jgi:uncharacterized protein involved in cysteine biosynthesis